MTPSYWNDALAHLKKRDPKLKRIIAAYKGEAMRLKGDGFTTLARAIVGQQISTKAADSVWKKFSAAVGTPTPLKVSAAAPETLRACGLSASKVTYMHALSAHFLENKKLIKRWPELPDDEILKELISIKGIGRWTAEMFLIFALGRPDIFPTGDLGLVKAIERHYAGGKALPRKKLLLVGEAWRPYRSVGTWYMWRSLDPVPVAY